MPSSFQAVQARALLGVGQRFLRLRPRIAALGALGNGLLLMTSGAPSAEKGLLALTLLGTLAGFTLEAWLLRRRALTRAWLLGSLLATMVALGAGAALSGGLASPLLPLLFAPTVIGIAAFGRTPRGHFVLVVGAALVALLEALTGHAPFPPFAPATHSGMLCVSTLASLALLATGVGSLVDAHAGISATLERLRADALHEAEHRAVSLERFGAEVAHEVKNPLTAVRGLVQLVQRRLADERDRQRLEVVVQEVDRALALLRDYLTFARPVRDLHLAEVDVRALLEDVAGVLEARAAEREVRLVVDVSGARDGSSGTLLGDRQRLRDAVLNLALNALAALPRGGTVRLEATRAAGRVQLRVVDDGPGLTPEQLQRFSQPFESESEGGTGLGLTVARTAARRHGGELSLAPGTEGGLTAVLDLPLAAGEATS